VSVNNSCDIGMVDPEDFISDLLVFSLRDYIPSINQSYPSVVDDH